MYKYKLTICIATYNRDIFLDKLLSKLCIQINDFDSISVLVVDGNSSDNTMEVCKKYERNYSNFKSIHLDSKGGVDKDFDIAVRNADSEFCWLFCDDDYIKEGSIETIVNKLNIHNPDIMIINSDVCNYELNQVLLEKSIDIESDLIIENDENMQDKLYEICQTYLGCSNALLFRRKIWCQINTEQYYGTRFGDMCTIGQFPKDSKLLITSFPYISIRLGNAEWSKINFKIWYELFPRCIMVHSQLSEKVKKILHPNNFYWHIKFLLWNKAMNTYELKQYNAYMRDKQLSIKLLALFVLCLPSYLCRLFFIIRAKMKNDKLAIYNLTQGRISNNNWQSNDETI